MQKVTNIRGWLKSINNHQEIAVADEKGFVELGAGDLFGFQINYDTPNNATALFNGNISETYWKTATDNMARNYGYAYDELNRLLQAQFYKEDGSDDGAYNESLSYDKNGNITYLGRWGKIYADAHRIDQLNYTYTGNQLRAVADETNSPQGFLDGNQTANDYEYDANGNLTTDRNKGITGIEYNHLNLPKLITFGGGQSISYLYNALGQKIQKQVSNGLQSSVTEYLSGFQYRQANMGRRISPSVPVLMYFPTAEGYVNWLAGQPKYVYNYTDHLGNIRLSYTFDEQNNMLKIMEENHYYPFGLKHQNYNSEMLDYTLEDNEVALQTFANQIGDGKYNYKYNGKEYQEELGLNVYDMDMRQYDPAIGRWTVQDPVVHFDMSPYNAFDNNPVFWADPSGADSWTYDWTTNDGSYTNAAGDRTYDWQSAVNETLEEQPISLMAKPNRKIYKFSDVKNQADLDDYYNTLFDEFVKSRNYEEGDGIFSVISHGHSDGYIQDQRNDKPIDLSDVYKLEKLLRKLSPEFDKAMKEGKSITLYFIGCSTAYGGKNSIAARFSAVFKNVTTKGFTDNVNFGRYPDNSYGISSVKNNGSIVTFKSGIEVSSVEYSKSKEKNSITLKRSKKQ